MITIQFSTGDGRALADTVARAANKLSSDILRKNPQITAVAVQQMSPGDWFIGDTLHSESYVHVNEVRGDAYGYGGEGGVHSRHLRQDGRTPGAGSSSSGLSEL
jgi:phenylpyruvate tautomerase PptA (4-oxalocrotonate tautomerase family)